MVEAVFFAWFYVVYDCSYMFVRVLMFLGKEVVSAEWQIDMIPLEN